MSSEHDDEDPYVNRSRAADMERIKLARKKRAAQLKSWQQYDRMMEKNKSRVSSGKQTKSKNANRNIHFDSSVVLLEAATREDFDEVKSLLSKGFSPNVCNDDGLTALHQACIDNSLEICELLLQYNVDVNATDSELWTPLHASAACAHIDICAVLINNGADLLALNAEGNMPYDICEEENTLDLIENNMAYRGITQEDIDAKRRVPELRILADMKELHKQGVDLCKLDKQGASMLHVAASCGYIDVAKFLLDHNVPINILDKDGWQPIHVAACWGQLDFIEFILLRGADINCATLSGESVYEICEDMEMNRRLQEMKAEIDRKVELKKSLEIKPALTGIGRRSTSSKRSASIRRSSMREKSLMSWKEARQEALMREAIQHKLTPTPDSTVSDEVGGGMKKDIDLGKNVPVISESNGDQNRQKIMEENEQLESEDRDQPVDLNQVRLVASLAAESEMTKKHKPLSRHGSTRSSFTHAHPYHSPSRDPSLLIQIQDSIPTSIRDVEEPPPEPPQPQPPTNQERHVKPLAKPRHKPMNPTTVNDTPSNANPQKTDNQLSNPDYQFIRNCDPNISIMQKQRQQQSNGSGRDAQTHIQPLPDNKVSKKKKKEIDNKQVLIKQNKVQGCCSVM